MLQKNFFLISFGLIFFGSIFFASAQTKRKTTKQPPIKSGQIKPEIVEEKPLGSPPKKNSRPEEQTENSPEPIKKNEQESRKYQQ